MFLGVVYLSLALGAEPAPYPNAKILIEPAQLTQKEVAEKSVIIDVRGEKSYTEGHVPGAIQVDVGTLSKAVNTDSEPEKWGSRLELLGIAPTSHVVIYGDDWRESARLWWILRYASVQDVRLLNGGWMAWTANGGKVSTTATKPRPRPVVARAPAAGAGTAPATAAAKKPVDGKPAAAKPAAKKPTTAAAPAAKPQPRPGS